MYLEIAILPVAEGKGAEFEAAFEKARTDVFPAAEGFQSAQLRRGVERAGEYALLIEWATLEDHAEKFPQSPQFQEFITLIGEFIAGRGEVAHWESV